MVKALLRIDDTLAEDAADGLAIAICHANTQASLIKLAGAKRFSRKRLR
jgi:crossover junction endodeoxyribonuclease RuvC